MYGDIHVKVVLTFESVDEILWCDHSNETLSVVLLQVMVLFIFKYFTKFNLRFAMNFDFRHSWEC